MVIALALVLVQQGSAKSIPVPVLPAGVEPHFSQAVSHIADLTNKGDFQKAAVASQRLPKSNFKIQIDVSSAPAKQRELLREAVMRAIKAWHGGQPQVTPTLVTADPDLKIGFNDVLAKPDGAALPAGVTLFFSDDAKEPSVEAVIGLKRGDPLIASSLTSITNDMQYAIGSYLGLAKAPFYGTTMYPGDMSTDLASPISQSEWLRAGTHLSISNQIRDAVKAKTKIIPAAPKIAITPTIFDEGTVIEGKKIPFQIQVSNNGDGPLNITVQPDCGCFSLARVFPVPPHSSSLLHLSMDSTGFLGAVKHHVAIITNDEEQPVLQIPFNVQVTARYRFLSNESVLIGTPKGGATTEAYLFTPDGAPLEIESARIDGLDGTVTFEPWEGMLADPDLKEPAKMRKGTKFIVNLGAMPAGRWNYTISVKTKDPDFSTVRFYQPVQAGIVALPNGIDLGDVVESRSGTFLVSRPGKPFKITSMEVDSPQIKLESTSLRDGSEYKITATYDGKAPKGLLKAIITIHMDDPDQPWMKIPFRVNVR